MFNQSESMFNKENLMFKKLAFVVLIVTTLLASSFLAGINGSSMKTNLLRPNIQWAAGSISESTAISNIESALFGIIPGDKVANAVRDIISLANSESGLLNWSNYWDIISNVTSIVLYFIPAGDAVNIGWAVAQVAVAL